MDSSPNKNKKLLKLTMTVLIEKVVAMVVLSVMSFLIGLSTFTMRKLLGIKQTEQKKSHRLTTRILLRMSCGVLLATSMLHILPDVRLGLNKSQEYLGMSWLAELVVCAGFLFAYIVEEMLHLKMPVKCDTELLPVPGVKCGDGKEYHSDMEMSETDSSNTKYNPKYEVKFSMSTSDMFPNYHSPEAIVTKVEDVKDTTTNIGKHSENHNNLPEHSSHSVRSILKVLALCIYILLEGLAVGKEENSYSFLSSLAVLSVRQVLITLLLFMELHMTVARLVVFFSYLTVFSLSIPTGVGLGLLMLELSEGDQKYGQLVVSMVQGLVGGMILYSAFCGIFLTAQSKRIGKLSTLAGLGSVVFGFSLFMGLELLGGLCYTEVVENRTIRLPHPYHAFDANIPLEEIHSQIVPLEDLEEHQNPGHVHLEDNSLVYALVNRTIG